jgi:tetrapyrrole methylase family protein/MazG family protein
MSEQIDRFVDIIARLRAPGGCPWDREQTHKSILNCLLDEAYEFFEAVDENDPAKICEELGDLLLQVVLHSQMAQDAGAFTIEDVARGIGDKMIRRHPHVFGDVKVSEPSDVVTNWEAIKKQEKGKERPSALDGIPPSLPALFSAEKIQRKAARVGFDWKDITPVLDKVEEEFDEFREAVEAGDLDHAEEELGDIIFALVNVGRHRGICAEDALRRTVRKFDRRFRYVEQNFRDAGADMSKASLAEMDVFWEESKGVVG